MNWQKRAFEVVFFGLYGYVVGKYVLYIMGSNSSR
jgi:hypothetical protein